MLRQDQLSTSGAKVSSTTHTYTEGGRAPSMGSPNAQRKTANAAWNWIHERRQLPLPKLQRLRVGCCKGCVWGGGGRNERAQAITHVACVVSKNRSTPIPIPDSKYECLGLN